VSTDPAAPRRSSGDPSRRRVSSALVLDIVAVALLATITAIYFRDRRSYETVSLVVLPLLLRRRWPIPILAIAAFGTLVTRSDADAIDIAAVALASYTAGDLVAGRAVSAAAVLLTAMFLSVGFIGQGQDVGPSLAIPFAVIVPAWIVGTLMRAGRVDAEAREAVRRRALEDREAALEAAIADQRRTIARELHDVVAHAVSVMVIQAGAARSVLATAPADAEQAIRAVETTGRDAMTELRRLLDVLADDGDGPLPALAPQAGIAQIESLVTRVREAGLPAELQVDGMPRQLPAGMDVTVYRIVQEALTNALRYAGRARTVVHLAFAPTELAIEVLDDGPGTVARPDGAPPGRGLIGMRERVLTFGGRLEAGPRDGRGYAVRAWLPTDGVAT
jgi:signal transduction histidine kinase